MTWESIKASWSEDMHEMQAEAEAFAVEITETALYTEEEMLQQIDKFLDLLASFRYGILVLEKVYKKYPQQVSKAQWGRLKLYTKAYLSYKAAIHVHDEEPPVVGAPIAVPAVVLGVVIAAAVAFVAYQAVQGLKAQMEGDLKYLETSGQISQQGKEVFTETIALIEQGAITPEQAALSLQSQGDMQEKSRLPPIPEKEGIPWYVYAGGGALGVVAAAAAVKIYMPRFKS